MRAVIQRVSHASVAVEREEKAKIGRGLLVLLGVEKGDNEEDIAYMAQKIPHLRVFPDSAGKMNRSAVEEQLPILVVPQFTLAGDVRRGRRPDYTAAEDPEMAQKIFGQCCDRIAAESSLKVQTGVFGARMDVGLVNDGPVTILLDSRRQF